MSMKSQFKSYDLNRLLTSFNKRFGREIQQGCQQRWVDLNAPASNGRLRTYDFEDGVQLFLLDGALPEDWGIVTSSKDESPFLLYFNVRGRVVFTYDGLAEPLAIEPMTTLMVSHPPEQTQTILFKGEEHTTFAWLKLDRHLYINHIGCLPDAVKTEVANIFDGITTVKAFHNSTFGLKGAQMLQQVLLDEQEGLIHATFAESKAIELFSLQLRRWEEEIVKPPTKSKIMHTDDMEKIIMARNLLLTDLKNAPTIEQLSKKSGVNRQKLKQGFKRMFGITINDYVRNERLRMAQRLLISGNYNVKDVSTMIGYENPSYFARRYKEKYGLYPHEYMRSAQAIGEEE
jgi:AraC family transcriptional regulator, transcriptional activator of the genes for pyochelin and ferripyochelin receptors